MENFYSLCKQIDIWEKDLQQEMEQFEFVKSDCIVATDEEKDLQACSIRCIARV